MGVINLQAGFQLPLIKKGEGEEKERNQDWLNTTASSNETLVLEELLASFRSAFWGTYRLRHKRTKKTGRSPTTRSISKQPLDMKEGTADHVTEVFDVYITLTFEFYQPCRKLRRSQTVSYITMLKINVTKHSFCCCFCSHCAKLVLTSVHHNTPVYLDVMTCLCSCNC